jgi:hypothetical protein
MIELISLLRLRHTVDQFGYRVIFRANRPRALPKLERFRCLRYAAMLADATVGRTATATADHAQPGMARRAARLSDRRGRACSRAHRHPSDEWSVTMCILKSLFEMGLSVLRAALRVVAEVALTRIVELAIAAV